MFWSKRTNTHHLSGFEPTHLFVTLTRVPSALSTSHIVCLKGTFLSQLIFERMTPNKVCIYILLVYSILYWYFTNYLCTGITLVVIETQPPRGWNVAAVYTAKNRTQEEYHIHVKLHEKAGKSDMCQISMWLGYQCKYPISAKKCHTFFNNHKSSKALKLYCT